MNPPYRFFLRRMSPGSARTPRKGRRPRSLQQPSPILSPPPGMSIVGTAVGRTGLQPLQPVIGRPIAIRRMDHLEQDDGYPDTARLLHEKTQGRKMACMGPMSKPLLPKDPFGMAEVVLNVHDDEGGGRWVHPIGQSKVILHSKSLLTDCNGSDAALHIDRHGTGFGVSHFPGFPASLRPRAVNVNSELPHKSPVSHGDGIRSTDMELLGQIQRQLLGPLVLDNRLS